MKKVLSIISLAAVLILSPNFAQASLFGDEAFIEVTSLGLTAGPTPSSAIIVDDPGNPEFSYSLCGSGGTSGGATVDVGESEIWFAFGSTIFCVHDAHSVWLTDLDWTGSPGSIVGVTQGTCDDIGPVNITFDDDEIHFDFTEFITDGGPILECHFDIQTEHAVGGNILPIDSTALVLAGLQSSAIWMLPVLAGAAGVGAFYLKTRMNKD